MHSHFLSTAIDAFYNNESIRENLKYCVVYTSISPNEVHAAQRVERVLSLSW